MAAIVMDPSASGSTRVGLGERGEVNRECPFLPGVSGSHDFSITRRHGGDRGEAYYLDALCYAQSQWMAGKPAQAILQLNKSWMADLTGDEPVLREHPSPYRALVWILETAAGGEHGFMGNPARHFQHLASRMSGPRAEVRGWRAWLCLHLAEGVLNVEKFPRDRVQVCREGLWIPQPARAFQEVAKRGWRGETDTLECRGSSIRPRQAADATFQEL